MVTKHWDVMKESRNIFSSHAIRFSGLLTPRFLNGERCRLPVTSKISDTKLIKDTYAGKHYLKTMYRISAFVPAHQKWHGPRVKPYGLEIQPSAKEIPLTLNLRVTLFKVKDLLTVPTGSRYTRKYCGVLRDFGLKFCFFLSECWFLVTEAPGIYFNYMYDILTNINSDNNIVPL